MKATLEEKRDQAVNLRKRKLDADAAPITIGNVRKNVISVDGKQFIDSQGGFLVDPTRSRQDEEDAIAKAFETDWNTEPVTCDECQKEFLESYLYTHFTFPVCDGCRDNETKHTLITKSDARAEYLLKDCDFDLREPPLKFISRKNPHNHRYAEMKLYLLPQVEKRALEVWGSFEELEEAHQQREEKRSKAKSQKYAKNQKAIGMAVRSSLFDRTSGPAHKHQFGPESYNESDDTYSKTCLTCKFVETYEKM